MSEAIAAVVFDLDGVLVASESVWDAAHPIRQTFHAQILKPPGAIKPRRRAAPSAD
jgi:phosphoglycolate phosphatase-like HAD superfamily hydrolase